MNKMITALGLVAFSALPSAFAAGGDEFSPEDLVIATQNALKDLGATAAEHVQHISGFKAWKSGADAKVKIYVAHDGMTMDYNYQCAKHATEVHCSAD